MISSVMAQVGSLLFTLLCVVLFTQWFAWYVTRNHCSLFRVTSLVFPLGLGVTLGSTLIYVPLAAKAAQWFRADVLGWSWSGWDAAVLMAAIAFLSLVVFVVGDGSLSSVAKHERVRSLDEGVRDTSPDGAFAANDAV